MQTEQQNILERIKIARGSAEPKPEPTAKPEAVNVSEADAEPADEVTEEVNTDKVAAEVEESEGSEAIQTLEHDDDEDLYVEYKGREINLKDVEQWEKGNLRQSDYTRKTQELADSRKELEAKSQEIESKASKLSEQLATLEAMVSEETLTSEELKEMREYDPEEYIKYTEKQSKRKEFLAEAKKNAKPQVNVQEEQARLIKSNPHWLDNGKPTEAYKKDMDALTKYYNDNGFTQSQVDAVNTNALLAQAVIEAARAKSLNNKNAAIEKRVRAAPVTTKPRSQITNSVTTEIEKMKAQVKKSGRPEDFVKLRKLQRQLNN